MQILALDVGTSSVKAAVLDVASADFAAPAVSEHYRLERPTPAAAVLPSERLWNAVNAAASRAVAGAPKVKIAGVGLSCMTPALILLDAADQPLTPIWTHFDRRSRPIARKIAADGVVGDVDKSLADTQRPNQPARMRAGRIGERGQHLRSADDVQQVAGFHSGG